MHNNLFGRTLTVYKHNFFKLLLACLIIGATSAVSNQLEGIFSLLFLLVSGPLAIGAVNFFLGAYTSGTANLGNLFTYVTDGKKYFSAIKLSIIVGIITFLLVLIAAPVMTLALLSGGYVPFIIVMVLLCIVLLYFGLTYYIFCTDDTTPALRCIGLSFKYMGVHIFKLIGLFILLTVVPVAITVAMALTPWFIAFIIPWTVILLLAYAPFISLILAGFYGELIPANFNGNTYNNLSNAGQIYNTPVTPVEPTSPENSQE